MQEKVSFKTRNAHVLAGILHRPDAGKPRAFALFAHCFTCTKNIKAAINIAESLCCSGIAVLRFDFTGLGQSEGDFAATNFSSNVEDLIAAADYLRQEHSAPTILVGHSLGGTACLAAALASCTAMTLNMYARHKELPLESVQVSVRHGKIHAQDCAECETQSGKIDRFEREIVLQGDLSEEQRQRRLAIADRCPVHKTLHQEVQVVTT